MTASRIVKSSGRRALDRAALDYRRAQPFPAAAGRVAGRRDQPDVPVRFNMRRARAPPGIRS